VMGSWVAIVVNTDSRAFPELDQILLGFGDPRLLAAIAPDDIPRERKHYGYDVTDWVISAAAGLLYQHRYSTPKWLVVTNGDNFYSSNALQLIEGTNDIVLLPLESRYLLHRQYRTESWRWRDRCQFVLRQQFCQRSEAVTGGTDLGAIVTYFPRFLSEGHRFLDHSSDECPICWDNFLLQHLLKRGWSVLTLEVPPASAACPFSHSPAPDRCIKLGGVWLEAAILEGLKCITRDEAIELLNSGDYDRAGFESTPNCLRPTADLYARQESLDRSLRPRSLVSSTEPESPTAIGLWILCFCVLASFGMLATRRRIFPAKLMSSKL